MKGAVTGQLIFTFVLAYVKSRFSHDMAQLLSNRLSFPLFFFIFISCFFLKCNRYKSHVFTNKRPAFYDEINDSKMVK